MIKEFCLFLRMGAMVEPNHKFLVSEKLIESSMAFYKHTIQSLAQV